MRGFDYLRLISAILVIAHHARVLNGEPPIVLGNGLDLGALGVGIFFVISGYLVAGSLERSPDTRTYLAKRALRIFPGLLVALVLTALVLGPLVTTLDVPAYLSAPGAWAYVVRNLSLYAVTYDLPGVFLALPVAGIVNGSLWTLRLEFTAYLAALNGFLFLAGANLQASGTKPRVWAAVAALVFLATPAWFLGLPLAVVRLGALDLPKLRADLSYGLYIYSFPLQQGLAQQHQLNLITSVLVTLPFATASWFLIEKPALGLKARLTPPASPAASVAD